MKRVFALFTIFVLSFAIVAAKEQQPARPLTIDDVLKVRRVSDPQISPDGRWIAFTIADTDKPANKRTSQIYLISTDGGEPRAARLLGAFSTWLQERSGPVFVVATANDVSRLPPELLRRGRFDELFFVDLPDLEARAEILGLHLRRRGRDPGALELGAIAELCADYSGAELEQVVVGALHRAFALNRLATARRTPSLRAPTGRR